MNENTKTSPPTILMRLKNYDDYQENGLCVITLTESLLRQLHHHAALVKAFCEEQGANHIEFDFTEGVEHLVSQPESLADYDLWQEEWVLASEPYDIWHNPAHEAEAAELTYGMRGAALRVYDTGDMVFRCYNKWSGLAYETDFITPATLDAWATILAGGEWPGSSQHP